MTLYVILQENERIDGAGKAWIKMNEIKASSATGAIRAHIRTYDDDTGDGQYIAIPLRSWQPQSVKIETERHVRIG